MTKPFDWAGLFREAHGAAWADGTGDAFHAAGEYLRERIEAAFVPVERYIARNLMWAEQVLAKNEATARAEAAEARVKVLEEALRRAMIGGNHLALLIGADHPAYGTEHYTALEHYGAGDQYEAWCAWNAIMLADDALGGEHDK